MKEFLSLRNQHLLNRALKVKSIATKALLFKTRISFDMKWITVAAIQERTLGNNQTNKLRDHNKCQSQRIKGNNIHFKLIV
jgi:hypothetical protein